ncbi:MAG TPA: GWxTD domain-containing protein [Candidatus Polarisedimenticolia bacterium]|nr:GWxTD domain-containing protein [Candidatus Polarisedimenticolia bacterium]
MTIRAGAVLLGCALVGAAAFAAGEAPDWKTPTKDWSKGPVRWLMDENEAKAFKALRTDEERQAFAKTFWEKRDPTPGTPANEYMEIFWKRVEQADKVYKDMIRQGSTTDLGRVFLLLGPPTATHKDSRYSYWTYEPNEISGIKEKLEFSFATVDTGTLLRSPKTLEEYVAKHPETRGIGWTLPQAAPAPAGDVAAAPVKEVVEDTSSESQRQIPIIDAVLAKKSGPTDVPFLVTNDFYAAADGTTLAVITVEVPRDAAHGSGTQAVLPFGRLKPEAEGGRTFNLTGDLPFVPAPEADAPSGGLVYQARRNLKPGAYTEVMVVEDRVVKGQMGTLVAPLTVPDLGAKTFAMSTVTLLASFRQMEAGLGPDDEKAGGLYSLGSFRLVPRASNVLTRADSLAWYYQVYNPGADPAGGRPNLEATYTFFLKDATAGWKPFRKPAVKPIGQVELFEVAIKDLIGPTLPLPVDFKVELKVTDKISNQSLTKEVQFSVH